MQAKSTLSVQIEDPYQLRKILTSKPVETAVLLADKATLHPDKKQDVSLPFPLEYKEYLYSLLICCYSC